MTYQNQSSVPETDWTDHENQENSQSVWSMTHPKSVWGIRSLSLDYPVQ